MGNSVSASRVIFKMSNEQNKIQNGNLALCQEFVQVAKTAVSKFPDLKHSWKVSEDKTCCSLNFPKQNEDGFDVLIEVSQTEVTVHTQGAHQHFDSDDTTNESKITNALALVRDLLSPHMRIRELRAGKSTYRWHIEALRNNKWNRECTTGLLLWNYFGTRGERIFRIEHCPAD